MLPSAPTGLVADQEIRCIQLKWNRNPEGGAVRYQVHRSAAPGGPYEMIVTTSSAKYADNIAGGVPYYYVVKAVDAAGHAGPPSPEVRRSALQKVRYQEESAVFAGVWKECVTWSSSSQSYRHSSDPAAGFTFPFTGTQVTWVAHRAPNLGFSRVYLDGVHICFVNQWASQNQWQYPVFVSVVLAYGPHVLKVHATGTKSEESTGTGISVDAFDVVQE